MKSVLLISSIPLNPTGRGMDVLTNCFHDQEWKTSHLQFPRFPYSNKKSSHPRDIETFRAPLSLIPYVDSVMWWLPKKIFDAIKDYNARRVADFDWSRFDCIVLESGKPLFLLDSIPENIPIIYRQSDSVKMVLSKSIHFGDLEDRMARRAWKIIVVKDYYRQTIPEEYQHKIRVIENGFQINEDEELKKAPNPYENMKHRGRRNAVYLGLAPVDPLMLDILCQIHKDVQFHILGPCIKNGLWRLKLKRHSNFTYGGFMTPREFLPRLKYADFAIVPYAKWPGIEHVGFTAKYLYFMYYCLPIVTYKRGEHPELAQYGIMEARDRQEFSNLVTLIKENPLKKPYDVDWEYYSSQGREKEYVEFIKSLDKDIK